MEQIVFATDGRDDTAAEQRLQILQRNRELLEHHFAQSPDKDIAFVVYELTPGMTLPPDVASFVISSVESNMIPTQLVQASRWTIYKALRRYQRSLHHSDPRDPKESRLVELLRNPAKPNCFWAVVIARKGKQVVECPAVD
jgi:hypothetical protein